MIHGPGGLRIMLRDIANSGTCQFAENNGKKPQAEKLSGHSIVVFHNTLDITMAEGSGRSELPEDFGLCDETKCIPFCGKSKNLPQSIVN
jgi:hypothetical protein